MRSNIIVDFSVTRTTQSTVALELVSWLDIILFMS